MSKFRKGDVVEFSYFGGTYQGRVVEQTPESRWYHVDCAKLGTEKHKVWEDEMILASDKQPGDEELKQPLEQEYGQVGQDIGKLVGEKQLAYGDSFGRSGECLRQMFPSGVPVDRMDDVLTIARILDKLFRIATDPDAFGESPYRDIAGYSILGLVRHEKKRKIDRNN